MRLQEQGRRRMVDSADALMRGQFCRQRTISWDVLDHGEVARWPIRPTAGVGRSDHHESVRLRGAAHAPGSARSVGRTGARIAGTTCTGWCGYVPPGAGGARTVVRTRCGRCRPRAGARRAEARAVAGPVGGGPWDAVHRRTRCPESCRESCPPVWCRSRWRALVARIGSNGRTGFRTDRFRAG